MNNVIIGTAGHVDHGKTQLIKALTGTDTDRLQEEKKRGITIELGFAHLTLPNGERAGIVDVPGHEKFVKNMLAGAGGMDVVLLVVAADEGFMPQTREHLGILTLLGTKEGIIVLTKADLVDGEWLEVVTEEVREEVKGTFLEQAPILPVSSLTGQGLEELRQTIFAKLEKAGGKNLRSPFRAEVDRVFTVEGFGTVITGTLLEGTVREGDEAMVYPAGIPARVRSLQVHGKNVPVAYAGQRTAINLAGLKKTDLARGDTVAKPESLAVSRMLDVRLRILGDTQREILDGSQLHFYHGTRDSLCKLILLEGNREKLLAGEEAYAQLRLSEAVATKPGDHFVVRFYSPLETVGGGVILDSAPPRHRRGDTAVLEGLMVKESGSSTDRTAQKLLEMSPAAPTGPQLAAALELDMEELEPQLATLLEGGLAVHLLEHWVHSQYLEGLWSKLEKVLLEYHRTNPLLQGLRREEVRGKIFPGGKDGGIADPMVELFLEEGRLRLENGRITPAAFVNTLTPAQKRLLGEVEERYRSAGFAVPTTDEVLALYPKEKELCRQVLEALQAQEILLGIGPGMLLHREPYQRALTLLTEYLEERGPIALGDFRDLLGTSRKYAVALLEHWDRRGITRKEGETRVLVKSGRLS